MRLSDSAPEQIGSALGQTHFAPGENCGFWHIRHSPGSCINQPGIAPNAPVYAVGTALQFRDGQTDLTAAKSKP